MYNRCAVVHYMFDNIYFNTSKLQRIQSSFFLNIYLYFQFNSEVNPVSCFETFVQANLRNKEVSSGVKMRAIWAPGNKKIEGPIFFFVFVVCFCFFSVPDLVSLISFYIRYWNEPTFSRVIWTLGGNILWALAKVWGQLPQWPALLWHLGKLLKSCPDF